MACTPFNYTNYNLGTTTCNQHRDACSTNAQIGNFAGTGGRINAGDIENLRANIMAEIDRFNAWQSANGQGNYGKADPGGISSGEVISSAHINDMRATVDQISGTGYGNVGAGNSISAPEWAQIVASYNVVASDCICNSDCSCNNVCSCYGNCGCNYSDERLKENIKLIDTVEDLNVYSYTYLWNKTKTFIGVMAQELLGTKYESAVSKDSNGFYFVDYSQLPITFKEA